ncbi:hypothetical protein RCL1_008230 [Eukaryota sp. TZLM3-RCL]
MNSPPRKQRRSEAYDHYEEYTFSQEGKSTSTLHVCKYCPDGAKKCYITTSSTDSLLQHVRKQHPEQLKLPRLQPLAGALKDAPIARNLSKKQQRILLSLIIRFVILKCLPLKIVESPKLLHILKFLNSFVKLSKRNTARKIIVRSCKIIEDKVLPTVANNNSKVSLTTDSWTSLDTKSFIAVTVHFIDENSSAKSLVLDIKRFPHPHTGRVIADTLMEILTRHNVKNLLSVTSNNGANMLSGLVLLGAQYNHYCNNELLSRRCLAHVFHLIVKLLEKPLRNEIKKVKLFATKFHHSGNLRP